MTETAATTTQDILVVGGGITGLAAATLLAQARRSVTLFEKSRAVGGRAATQVNDGFHFNLGPHALCRAGRGAQVLRELGIDTNFGGGTAPLSGSYAVDGGAEYSFPNGVFSLFATRLLGFSAKLEAVSVFASLRKIDPQPIQSVTLQQWLNHRIHHPDVRRLLVALFRLATYSDDPEHQSAGAALAQLQMSMADSVFYLDSGWQVLVERLRLAAEEAGVRIVTGTPVVAIEHDEAVRGIRLADGTTRAAESVIVAASPTVACNLVEGNGKSVLNEAAFGGSFAW